MEFEENISEQESLNLEKFEYNRHKLSVRRLTGIFIVLDLALAVLVVTELIRYIQTLNG
jgi:hypothetical protein